MAYKCISTGDQYGQNVRFSPHEKSRFAAVAGANYGLAGRVNKAIPNSYYYNIQILQMLTEMVNFPLFCPFLFCFCSKKFN